MAVGRKGGRSVQVGTGAVFGKFAVQDDVGLMAWIGPAHGCRGFAHESGNPEQGGQRDEQVFEDEGRRGPGDILVHSMES